MVYADYLLIINVLLCVALHVVGLILLLSGNLTKDEYQWSVLPYS